MDKTGAPSRRRELHFTQTSLQWVVTAYAITFGGFLLLGGLGRSSWVRPSR